MRNNIIFNNVKDNPNDLLLFRFYIPKSKKNTLLGYFIASLLLHTCKTGFLKKSRELQYFYDVKNYNNYYYGKGNDTFIVNYFILNNRYIKDKDFFENVIQYIYNDIFNHVQYFTEDSVNKVKEMMISNINDLLSQPEYYLDTALNKELDRQLENFCDKKTIKRIQSVTLEEIKEFYLNMLKCKYLIILNGEITKQKKDIINTVFDKYKISINPKFHKLKKRELVRIDDKQKVGQSGFTLIYYIDNFKSNFRNNLIANLFNNLLQDNVLMKYIREEMNLCYSIYVEYDLRKNGFYIKCLCSKNRIKEGIEATIQKLSNIDELFTKEYFLAQKKTLKYYYEGRYDYVTSLAYLFYKSLYNDFEKDPMKIIQEIETITLEEVKDFANNLVLIGEYHLLGEK